MADIEVRLVTPEEIGRELEDTLRRRQENKYAFQVKLADLDIAVDEEKATAQGTEFPFRTIEAAEAALRSGIITPTLLMEVDGTRHEIVAFYPTPVGYSGFQDCVTHSLAVTDHGLFEVGRFAAVSFKQHPKRVAMVSPSAIGVARRDRYLASNLPGCAAPVTGYFA